MSNKTPFDQTLKQLNRGEINDELTDIVADVVKAVRSTRKKGSVTLTLEFNMLNSVTEDTMKITPKISSKLPELPRDESIVFSTASGDVLFDDPSQLKMELKTVADDKPKAATLKVIKAA